jgi:hypothetical protein
MAAWPVVCINALDIVSKKMVIDVNSDDVGQVATKYAFHKVKSEQTFQFRSNFHESIMSSAVQASLAKFRLTH